MKIFVKNVMDVKLLGFIFTMPFFNKSKQIKIIIFANKKTRSVCVSVCPVIRFAML